jgi:hypothetical protein
MLIGSIFPLLKTHIPLNKNFNFTNSWKNLSWKAILANVNPDHNFVIFALPLFFVQFFGSIDISIWIVGTTAILSAIFTYYAGILKDAKRSSIYILAMIVNIAVWIGYGTLSSIGAFVILGILLNVSSSIIDAGREAKLSRETQNAQDTTETVIAMEFARSVGGVIGYLILIISFSLYLYIPQSIFLLGALFVLPRGLYAIGNVREKLIVPKTNQS